MGERSRRQNHLRAEQVLIQLAAGRPVPQPRFLSPMEPAGDGGFLFFASSNLPELRKGLDEPEREVLEAAGQEQDAGRDQKRADGFLDPAELSAQLARSADERADRSSGDDEDR